jgi:SAM-dependent methyltransferase
MIARLLPPVSRSTTRSIKWSGELTTFRHLLVCPECHNDLRDGDGFLFCSLCNSRFPVVNGIPVLLSSNSVFSADQVVSATQTYYAEKVVENSIKQRFRKNLPKLTGSRERTSLKQRVEPLIKSFPKPIIGLQIGAGENPNRIAGMFPDVQWLQSDVDLGYKPDVIADVTGLPIADGSFDLVIADQVLEHVIDIGRAAQEIQRILRVGGIVIVGVPFIYPFHGVPFDFYRVTPCGIRAIFPETESVYIGRGSGAWSALALQLDNRLINIFSNRYARMGASAVSRFLFGGLKYLDNMSDVERNMVSCASIVYNRTQGAQQTRTARDHE